MTATRSEPSLGVVIPAYNEEAGIERTVAAVCEVLRQLPCPARLLVVEDGSQDRTLDILQRLAAQQPLLTVVPHGRNRGYGVALRTGARTARDMGLEYVLFMDSDLTNDPADIVRFIPHMRKGVGVIKATRYSLGGGIDGVPFRRWVVSAVGNRVARLLAGLPLHDLTNGFRAVRVDLLSRMQLTEDRFEIIMEETWWYAALQATCAEVPVTLTTRQESRRPTAFAYTPGVFWRYLKYPLRSFAHRLIGRRPATGGRE